MILISPLQGFIVLVLLFAIIIAPLRGSIGSCGTFFLGETKDEAQDLEEALRINKPLATAYYLT